MSTLALERRIDALMASANVSRERKRLVGQFAAMMRHVDALVRGDRVPTRTQAKAAEFLRIIAAKERDHDDEFLMEAFLLNFVGEATVAADFLNAHVIEFHSNRPLFLRHFAHRSFSPPPLAEYMTAHGDLLMSYTSRAGLKSMVARGRERLESGRPFCLVNDYLNALKKAYWATLKSREDACDTAVSMESVATESQQVEVEPTIDRDATPITSDDRVEIMARLFVERLSETQQRAYLMRHPFPQSVAQSQAAESFDDALMAFMADLENGGESRSSWTDVAELLGASEKTVKKEYLRALHALLSGACDEIFDGVLPSGVVRRVLATLRKIIDFRDLKIRDNAGLGLTRIVERWEIALRFVLNNDRVTASEGENGLAHSAMF